MANADIETVDKKVKDTAELHCERGFIFKSAANNNLKQSSTLKNTSLLCSLDIEGQPIWVEKKFPNKIFSGQCVPGNKTFIILQCGYNFHRYINMYMYMYKFIRMC